MKLLFQATSISTSLRFYLEQDAMRALVTGNNHEHDSLKHDIRVLKDYEQAVCDKLIQEGKE